MRNFPNCLDCKKELKGYQQKRCASCAGKKRMRDISVKRPKKCEKCDKEFLKPWYSIKAWGKARFCSAECHENIKDEKKCLKCRIMFIKKGDYSLESWNKVKFCSKKCRVDFLSGENSPHWKGGITELYRTLRTSSYFIKWRKDVFANNGTICSICGNFDNLHIHHIKSLKNIIIDNNIKSIIDIRKCKELWDVNNGVVLCFTCHKKTENYGNRKNITHHK